MSRRAKASIIVTVTIYMVLIYAVFAESEFWEKSFGSLAFGLPTPFVAAVSVTLLYLPAPWFAWHGIEVLIRGQAVGMPSGKLGVLYTLFTIGRQFPELRRSQYIAIGGLVYFITIMAVWIHYADSHGL